MAFSVEHYTINTWLNTSRLQDTANPKVGATPRFTLQPAEVFFQDGKKMYLCSSPTKYTMFRFRTRHIGKFWILAMAAVLAVACGGGKREAITTAKAFLQAYYVDLDFAKALSLSSESSHSAIKDHAEIIALNPYAKEESPDIVWVGLVRNENDPGLATCTYTCNRVEKTLPLHKINGEWKVDLNGSTVETYGAVSNFLEFSSTNQGGFAASSSGEIKYKKRRQNNR